MLFSFNQLCNGRHHRFLSYSILFSCREFLHSQGTVMTRVPVRAFASLTSTAAYSCGHLFNWPQGTCVCDQTVYCYRLWDLLNTASPLPHHTIAGNLCLSSEFGQTVHPFEVKDKPLLLLSFITRKLCRNTTGLK